MSGKLSRLISQETRHPGIAPNTIDIPNLCQHGIILARGGAKRSVPFRALAATGVEDFIATIDDAVSVGVDGKNKLRYRVRRDGC